MLEALTYTIGQLYRLADEYTGDVAGYRFQDLYQVFNFTRQIPYVRDVDACGYEECLKRPLYGVQGGDCDDKAIFAGAALTFLKIPWRAVTTSYTADKIMQHVYLEVYDRGTWRPFDATYENNTIFTERPYTDKITWRNPMLRENSYGVATLEGIGDLPTVPNKGEWEALANSAGKQVVGPEFNIKNVSKTSIIGSAAAIATAAVPIPVVGTIVGAIVGYFLSLVGIKRPTEHLSPEDATARAAALGRSILDIYDRLPQDGKAFVAAQCDAFLADMQGSFGAWWGGMDLSEGDNPAEGFLNRILRKQRAAHPDWFNTEPARVYNSIFFPCYAVLRAADLSTLGENFKAWVVDRKLAPIVLQPIKGFIETRLKQIVEINQDGTLTVTDPSASTPGQASFSGILPWLMIGGLGLALVTSPAQRGGRGRK